MSKLVNYILDIISEWKWLKTKPCAACKHFMYFHGSAGICTQKKGCAATKLQDYSSTCDCGKFKKIKGDFK